MSYFVIKGPEGQGQYLCSMPGHKCPQWYYQRTDADRFPDEESAWRRLRVVQCMHAGMNYSGRVVRVNTLRDWKAERAQLRADLASWRAVADLRKDEIDRLGKRVAELATVSEGKESNG